MKNQRMSAVCLAALMAVAGCSTKRYITRDDLATLEGEQVWVSTTSGAYIELLDPEVEDGRLTGFVALEGPKEIDLSEVDSLEVEEFDKKKAAKIGVIAGICGAGLLWLLTGGGGFCFT